MGVIKGEYDERMFTAEHPLCSQMGNPGFGWVRRGKALALNSRTVFSRMRAMDAFRYVTGLTMVTAVTYFPAYARASEIASRQFDSGKYISVIACKVVSHGDQLAELGKRVSEVDSNAIFPALLK